MSNWLDNMHRNSKKLTSIAYALESLGNSFSHVGNETVASELFHISDLLLDISKSNRETAGDIVNRELRESREMTGAIVNAALAGALVDKNLIDKEK